MVGSSDHRVQTGITACSRNESTEKIMARVPSLEGAAGYRGESLSEDSNFENRTGSAESRAPEIN